MKSRAKPVVDTAFRDKLMTERSSTEHIAVPSGGLRLGLPPLMPPSARALVLGSMPGEASLAARQYYAHPRNAFWPIMARWIGFDAAAPYAERMAALSAAGIALWDVLAACEREGSLDTAIAPASMRINDFAALFATCPGVRRVGFNGALAERLFRRAVLPTIERPVLALLRLPSTSPAHAGRSLAAKIEAWGALFAPNDDAP